MTRPSAQLLPLVSLLTLLAAATPACIAAQTSEPSTIHAIHAGASVAVDGRLADDAWAAAAHLSNFTQRELDFGSPATERTEVAVLYDDDALYIGFWGYDREPERILANEMAGTSRGERRTTSRWRSIHSTTIATATSSS